jgi:hypothetical protein
MLKHDHQETVKNIADSYEREVCRTRKEQRIKEADYRYPGEKLFTNHTKTSLYTLRS